MKLKDDPVRYELNEELPWFDHRRFLPANLAQNIASCFDLFHDGATFYWFLERGVWAPCHHNSLGQVIIEALKSQARGYQVKETLYLLEQKVFKTAEELRPDPSLINMRNGMFDLSTEELRLHDKRYLSRTQLPIVYDRKAKCPTWQKCLRQWFPEDPDKIRTVQQFMGYCLYNHIFIHKCLFLIGIGANGKSVLTNTLIKIIGLPNTASLGLHQLGDKFLLGTLRDKLLNTSTEVATNSKVADEIFKKTIAGDLIQADMKHKPPFHFYPIAKHVFSMNGIPIITDKSFAFARRLLVLKFNEVFEGKREDTRLEDKLTDELSGIFNFAVTGLRQILKTRQITESRQMREDKKDFIKQLDPVSCSWTRSAS